jgi:hypothetical protein
VPLTTNIYIYDGGATGYSAAHISEYHGLCLVPEDFFPRQLAKWLQNVMLFKHLIHFVFLLVSPLFSSFSPPNFAFAMGQVSPGTASRQRITHFELRS